MYQGKTKIELPILFAIIITIIALIFIRQHYQPAIIPDTKVTHQQNSQEQPHPTSSLDTLPLLPATLLLPVPFTPQAPTGNWDELHNEACEEAAALMANAYYSGISDTNLSSDYVENQIDKLTSWQQDHYGYYLDITSEETARMMEGAYGLKTKLIPDFTADSIKKELELNHIVIISENGRLLGNPYYKQPGPIHHMLLLKGYDSDNFITNDPGTKRGLNYAFDFSTLYNAAADWVHSKNTTDTHIKTAIAVWK